MYCDDCLFYRIEYLEDGCEPFCKAHSNLTAPIFEAEEKKDCDYHLTVPVAKIQASVRNSVFKQLGDPKVLADNILEKLRSEDNTLIKKYEDIK